jgi:hypothetical protein
MKKKKKYRFILPILFLAVMLFAFIFHETVSAQQTPPSTYPLYGGWNDYDTYAPGWIAGSDNVVWDFASHKMVYRQVNSLSLKYNPKGEFHMTTANPMSLNTYKWLSFNGRAEDDGLDFGITFIDSANNPIGTTLTFSGHGGKPTTDYWTQYNFPIADFGVSTASVGGIRITQLSDSWGATIYLDEIYLSTARGENINPALPTPNPSDAPTPPLAKERKYPPDTNPFVYIVPAVFAVIIVLFH